AARHAAAHPPARGALVGGPRPGRAGADRSRRPPGAPTGDGYLPAGRRAPLAGGPGARSRRRRGVGQPSPPATRAAFSAGVARTVATAPTAGTRPAAAPLDHPTVPGGHVRPGR